MSVLLCSVVVNALLLFHLLWLQSHSYCEHIRHAIMSPETRAERKKKPNKIKSIDEDKKKTKVRLQKYFIRYSYQCNRNTSM